MSLNLQRVGEAVIADGSITETKIANGAVTSDKLANNSVIQDKIADLAIATAKLQDNAITLAKADRALNVHHLLTDDTESSVEGTTETEIKTFKFIKASSATQGFIPKYLTLQGTVKTSDATKQGSLKVYIDEEETARITINTTSESYELANGQADVSDLSNGSHNVSIRLLNADSAGITYNQLLTSFLEKAQS